MNLQRPVPGESAAARFASAAILYRSFIRLQTEAHTFTERLCQRFGGRTHIGQIDDEYVTDFRHPASGSPRVDDQGLAHAVDVRTMGVAVDDEIVRLAVDRTLH